MAKQSSIFEYHSYVVGQSCACKFGVIFVVVVVMLMTRHRIFLFQLFTGNNFSHTILTALGAFIFSVYIIYDTQLIMKHLSADEYIVGVINLYVDIINLFVRILRLLDQLKNDENRKEKRRRQKMSKFTKFFQIYILLPTNTHTQILEEKIRLNRDILVDRLNVLNVNCLVKVKT